MTAVYIIIVGLLSIMSLVVFNIKIENFNNNMLIASNLAREGIEVVRNRRDTNWLQGDAITNSWDYALAYVENSDFVSGETNRQNSFYFFNTSFGGSTFFYIIRPLGISLENCMNSSFLSTHNIPELCKLRILSKTDNPNIKFYDITGVYTTPPAFEETPFYRMLIINPICVRPGYPEFILSDYNQSCTGNNIKIGIQVKSIVAWNSGFGIKKVEIEDRLYNWK